MRAVRFIANGKDFAVTCIHDDPSCCQNSAQAGNLCLPPVWRIFELEAGAWLKEKRSRAQADLQTGWYRHEDGTKGVPFQGCAAAGCPKRKGKERCLEHQLLKTTFLAKDGGFEFDWLEAVSTAALIIMGAYLVFGVSMLLLTSPYVSGTQKATSYDWTFFALTVGTLIPCLGYGQDVRRRLARERQEVWDYHRLDRLRAIDAALPGFPETPFGDKWLYLIFRSTELADKVAFRSGPWVIRLHERRRMLAELTGSHPLERVRDSAMLAGLSITALIEALSRIETTLKGYLDDSLETLNSRARSAPAALLANDYERAAAGFNNDLAYVWEMSAAVSQAAQLYLEFGLPFILPPELVGTKSKDADYSATAN
ncbi:MAG: hypothetical protein PHT12_05290 [Patescibacteria group bacterium]|nr:hypothetical protein [Patescibacteria group bacterium]